MAIKSAVTESTILTETAFTNIQINRSINGPGASLVEGTGTLPNPSVSVSIGYANAEYLVGEGGEKLRLLTQGLCPKWFNLSEEKAAALVALLSDLVDAEIVAEMAKQAAVASA